MHTFISKQHQPPKNGELETSLNKNHINESHMEVPLDNTVNNNRTKESDIVEEDDMGIYEDNDKSGSDEESVDDDNLPPQKKNNVTDLENNSPIDEVDVERENVRIDSDSDDNKWINNEMNLTSKSVQTPKFTLGEWQLLAPSPVPIPVPVPVGPSLIPAPVRTGPSLVPVGPYPVSFPIVPSKDDISKANEYYRSKESSAVYTNSLIISDTSTHPPLNRTLDNKTLLVKNSDNFRFHAVLGAVPPYPPSAPLRPKSASAIPSNRMTRHINFEQDEKSIHFNGNIHLYLYNVNIYLSIYCIYIFTYLYKYVYVDLSIHIYILILYINICIYVNNP